MCWLNLNFKIVGEILVCHTGGRGSIICWPCTCWIFKKNSKWDPGLSYQGSQSSFDRMHVESLKKFKIPIWQTRISPRIFLKIQHVHGQKMIGAQPPQYDRQEYSTEFFFKDSTCTWSKDDWPLKVWQTRISPRIFLKIQHVHGQKMIDPPRYDKPGSHLEFF